MNDFDDEIYDWQDDFTEHKSGKVITPKVSSKKGKGYKRMHQASNRTLPIAAMDDKHLENFINLMIEKMDSIKSQALYEVGESGDLFELELNGVQRMDKSTAINIISSIMYKLEPYITELVIRGNSAYIMNINPKLENILGRKKISDVGKKLLS